MRRSSLGRIGTCTASVLGALCAAASSIAQAPPGYYDHVDLTSTSSLRTSLHATIKDHTRIPYTASSTDTWDVLERADEDAANTANILDLYRKRSYLKVHGGNTDYDREHSWPKSYGFPNDDGRVYPYTDCHHLFLCDVSYNSTRSNKPFANCTASASEYPIEGGASGVFPGTSNWSAGSLTNGSWQVWRDRRGDVARAMFYMDVRYEGGVHGVTGWPEPDLILTNDRNLIDSRNTGNNETVGYMGLLSTLLIWNLEDPPDAREMHRNDVVFHYQHNRNPFIDHPEWVALLFGGSWPGSFANYGSGCIGSNGLVPQLTGTGQPLLGQVFQLGLISAPASVPAVLNIDVLRRSIDLTSLGLGGCTALALPVFGIASATGPTGSLSLPLAIPNSFPLLTASVHTQWLVLDPAGRGLVLSNGGSLTFGKL